MNSMPRAPVPAYVALGANLGDPASMVRSAIDAIGALAQVQLLRRSRLYRSAPVHASGPDYVNAVVGVSTTLDAYALLAGLRLLEDRALRERPYRNAPRTLDLDLLLYGQGRIDSPGLTIPHPRMGERAFVLLPLSEIAPHLVDARQLGAVSDQPCVPIE